MPTAKPECVCREGGGLEALDLFCNSMETCYTCTLFLGRGGRLWWRRCFLQGCMPRGERGKFNVNEIVLTFYRHFQAHSCTTSDDVTPAIL